MANQRPTYIIANWKMHKTIAEALQFLIEIEPFLPNDFSSIVGIAAPTTAIAVISECKQAARFVIGAQNLHPEPFGAYTGEISAGMLLDAGARFVLIGHSERRHLFGESNALIEKKLLAALEAILPPILCIGETLEEKEAGKTADVLALQLTSALSRVKKHQLKQLTIAYEPVWAIGSGKVMTADDVETELLYCRELIAHQWDRNTAESIPIIYGGSVNGENARRILSRPNVDGVLVGGASLDPTSFASIIPKKSQIRI